MTTGVVYIQIRLELNQDIDEEKVNEFVQELDYKVTDEAGLIANTEITDFSIYCN